MSKPTLTELYKKYSVAKNSIEKSGYGTLYRMAGGKKEIPEYSLDMMWYIAGVDRLRRADSKYSTLLEKDNVKMKQREEQLKFYLPRYRSVLEYIAYVYGMQLVDEKESQVYRYHFLLDGSRVLFGMLSLDTEDFYAELYEGLRRLKIEFYSSLGNQVSRLYVTELYYFERELLLFLEQMNCTLGTGHNPMKEVK